MNYERKVWSDRKARLRGSYEGTRLKGRGRILTTLPHAREDNVNKAKGELLGRNSNDTYRMRTGGSARVGVLELEGTSVNSLAEVSHIRLELFD